MTPTDRYRGLRSVDRIRYETHEQLRGNLGVQESRSGELSRRDFRFATAAMRDGQLLRAFTTMVGASCFALVALGIVVQFHPAGPVGVLPRSVQAAVLLSAAVIGLRWLLGPWPQYRQAIAFVVWADAAVATVAVTMSTPESRLCTALYMGLTGGFAAFLLGGRILTAHCGFCVALIVGITGWGVRFEHATFFGLFVYYMPGLMWTVALPLGCLALIDLGRRSIRRTAHSAHYDPLTGLRNRRGMYAAVAAAIERTSPNITTVAVCDIDRFKVFNDSQGHAAGDTALLDMAQKLQSLAGIDDVTARIGGDELVLVAFCNSHDDIADLLGRLQPLTHRRVDGAAPTASLGVAFHDAEDPHFLLDYVLSRADAAMYEAKRAGGAKCVVYQPSITPDQAVTAIEPSPPPGLTAL